jgi:hypothetical protein
MSLIDKIRTKSSEEKMRIIWIAIGVTLALLVLLWIATSKISSSTPKDTTLFKTIGRGLKDIRENYKK